MSTGHPLHSQVKAMIWKYYSAANEGAEPEWDASEQKALSLLLKSNPNAPYEHWRGCLIGRYKSDINHAERPRCWIPYLSSYRRPVNAYKQPKEDEHGTPIAYGYRTKGEKTLAAAQNVARYDPPAVDGASDRPQSRDGRGGIFDLLAGIGGVSHSGSDQRNRAALPAGRSAGQDFDAEPWRDGDGLPDGRTEAP